MMRVARRAAPLVLALGLLSCGSLPPFETVPPPLPKGEKETATRVAVCYNMLTATADQVMAIARQSCGTEAKPRPIGHDYSLNNCPVLQPGRATFACPEPAETPAAAPH